MACPHLSGPKLAVQWTSLAWMDQDIWGRCGGSYLCLPHRVRKEYPSRGQGEAIPLSFLTCVMGAIPCCLFSSQGASLDWFSIRLGSYGPESFGVTSKVDSGTMTMCHLTICFNYTSLFSSIDLFIKLTASVV